MPSERIPYDRLSAVDLRDLSEEHMTGLRREAMRRGVSMSGLLGQLVDEMAKRIINAEGAKQDNTLSSVS